MTTAFQAVPLYFNQEFTDGGVILAGGLLYTYVAGSTTPVATYPDSTLNPSNVNANPMVLDSAGRITTEIWAASGTVLKFILKDSAGNTVLTRDNVPLANDSASTLNEWVASGLTPTYISGTSFSVAGNQTSVLTVNRRIQAAISAGTYYGYISASSFAGGVTTVTVVADSGALDSGMSSFNYGLLNGSNPSIPGDYQRFDSSTTIASASTVNIFGQPNSNVIISGVVTITAFDSSAPAGIIRFVKFSGALLLTYNATSLILPGAGSITTSAGDQAIFRSLGSGNAECISYVPVVQPPLVVPRSYLAGLVMSTAGSSATMSVAAGMAADSTNVRLMNLSAAIAKTTSAWAVGNAQGGLDTGNIANTTWYAFYLIQRVDTNVVDVLFSLSGSAPTLPTGYTLSRRIGWGLIDGSAHWVAFKQYNDRFIWLATVNDVNAQAMANTGRTARTLSVPVSVDAIFNVDVVGATSVGSYVLFTSTDQADNAASATNFTAVFPDASATGTAQHGGTGDIQVRADASHQVNERVNTGTANISYMTRGWVDTRGKES